MEKTFKPSGYNSLSPYFVVDGAEKLANLLKKIFQVEELRRYERPDGKIMHMELKIDDSVIMMADSTEQFAANKLLVHVYVPDVDKTFQKAVDAGCEPIEKPVQKEGDPDKRGSFLDFNGNMWSIATQGENK